MNTRYKLSGPKGAASQTTVRGPFLAMASMVLLTGVAIAAGLGLFYVHKDDNGLVRSATPDPTLNAYNKFFDHNLGTNGQACVSCHLPSDGFDLHVQTILDAFKSTQGLDQLFRTNDTADRPDADVSTLDARLKAYRLFREFGIVRIGKSLPPAPVSGVGFTVAPQDTPRFGPLPNSNDPQAVGKVTLSLFRRPLVNTNVNFDSSVLWDGRASITDMPGQVKKAATALLLAGTISDADAQNVAAFMTGVYTDQIEDDVAGWLDALGAKGGVKNLMAIASDPKRPCVFSAPGVLTPFVPPTCTPVVMDNPRTMDMFEPWASLPDNSSRNAARLSIARGEELFNTITLHVPPDLQIPGLTGNTAHCVTCHATNNLGNNPDATFFVRIGTDSVPILKELADADPLIKPQLANVRQLPQYCLRPTSDPTPFTTAPCGTHLDDVRTTDPGRAMVSGLFTDVGKFKPPILRDLNVRSPYFHNGSAGNIEGLVNFYNARFLIGLTVQQKLDLGNFIDTAF
jgi:cytochrome c peroxidase